MAAEHGQERWMEAAVLSSAANTAPAIFAGLLKDHRSAPGAETLLKGLASSIGSRREDLAVGELLESVAALKAESEVELVLSLLDGLLDGLQRGDQSAASQSSEKAVQMLLANAAPQIRLRALKIADRLQLADSTLMKTAWEAAQGSALDTESTLDERLASVFILGASPWPFRQSLAALVDPHQPLELQLAAIESLSAADHADVPKVLLANWSSLSPQSQEAVSSGLFARPNRLPALLDAIDDGTVQSNHLTSLRRAQLLEHADDALRQRAKSLLLDANQARTVVVEEFRAALALARDAEHGRVVFDNLCAKCHRLNGRGYGVGPDLSGAKGRPDATLLTDILDPAMKITPGYAVYTVLTSDGRSVTGVLTSESATSVTLRREQAVEDTILRRDIDQMWVSSQSLMPEGLEKVMSPQDAADLLGYLREALGPETPPELVLFDEEPEFVQVLHQGGGTAELWMKDKFSGQACLRVTPLQRHSSRIPSWEFSIAEHPQPGAYRYLRWAWKSPGDAGAMIELAADGAWPSSDESVRRYYCGRNTTDWQAAQVSREPAREWTTVTVDLWKDCGAFTLTGIAPTAMGGPVFFDRIELLRSLD
jgi:putative heme-binding domain-containing protein